MKLVNLNYRRLKENIKMMKNSDEKDELSKKNKNSFNMYKMLDVGVKKFTNAKSPHNNSG